jgi:hypothetical protein
MAFPTAAARSIAARRAGTAGAPVPAVEQSKNALWRAWDWIKDEEHRAVLMAVRNGLLFVAGAVLIRKFGHHARLEPWNEGLVYPPSLNAAAAGADGVQGAAVAGSPPTTI